MAMDKKGLTKLVEECAELSQIAAKKMAYLDVDIHPDGNNMKDKLEEEIADVLAAISFVTNKFDLNSDFIETRKKIKISKYEKWDNEL